MQPFTQHTGKVLPIDRTNVDTDAILPKQYLKFIGKFGFGGWLFDDLRYLDPGDVETDLKTRRLNPDFVLNQPRLQGATILLGRKNFGCGSSRESAVWALRDYGIRVVIAPSFADIFYNNCFKNGILPITLPESSVDQLFLTTFMAEPPLQLCVDLEACVVRQDNDFEWPFTVDEARRQKLLLGRDDIAETLLQAEKIKKFEQRLKVAEPWLF
ncbi:3-isopropylmalate dehydratase small subunit [Halioxenophilus sp. WMMB6]|uniref:3-isopropylmalate dehydratase small subunit n=1 Tax=Halioxenophilus sp. WMMB6 TaxID=3073815 RepID=UPI00295F39F8|nr:3-isopropylmalate dehydratase small subunit [Halioxenophilus sp. WMMB6]